MTRLKPRKLYKIKEAIGAVDKAVVDRGDLHDQSKIQELDSQMNNEMFDGKISHGTNKNRSFQKRIRKSHKGLR